MRYFVTIEGKEVTVDISEKPGGALSVTYDGKPVEADVVAVAGALSIRLDGKMVDLTVEGAPPELGIVANGHRVYLRAESDRLRASARIKGGAAAGGDGVITSPMPGRVVKILVEIGAEVAAQTPVIVVEAMKMENELRAPIAGVVKSIVVTTGQAVEGGAKLLTIEPAS